MAGNVQTQKDRWCNILQNRFTRVADSSSTYKHINIHRCLKQAMKPILSFHTGWGWTSWKGMYVIFLLAPYPQQCVSNYRFIYTPASTQHWYTEQNCSSFGAQSKCVYYKHILYCWYCWPDRLYGWYATTDMHTSYPYRSDSSSTWLSCWNFNHAVHKSAVDY